MSYEGLSRITEILVEIARRTNDVKIIDLLQQIINELKKETVK